MIEPIRVFIGSDHVEEIAYHVLSSSIIRYASRPVSITPVKLSHLDSFWQRDRDPKQSNEFSFSRFLVPYLCNYEGWAIFLDCDMVLKTDIAELWDQRDEQYAIQVVKHDYTPKNDVKYLDNKQYKYDRKNWSSVMLMNCAKCQGLTLNWVKNQPGLNLHRFSWLADSMIGGLDPKWNWLADEYDYIPDPKLIHYTVGGPWFEEFQDSDFLDEWVEEMGYAFYVKDEGCPFGEDGSCEIDYTESETEAKGNDSHSMER